MSRTSFALAPVPGRRTVYGEGNRCKQMKRWLDLIVMLSRRAYTVNQIAEKTGCSHKTIRRDLRGLEEVGLPLYVDRCDSSDPMNHEQVWRIDRHWMNQFVKAGTVL